MRIMLTVLGEQGDRDVVIDGADDVTVAAVSAAVSDQGPLADVVSLPRTRAPYAPVGAGRETRVPRPRRPERAAPEPEPPTLWRDGRPLDPRARALSVLRDGDKVALDPRHALATLVEEPGGVAEIRVVGGPAAGAVHRLALGAHVIGSDPACAVCVADPALAAEAVLVRVTSEAVTVEPAPRRRPGQAPPPKVKGRWAGEVAELSARTAEREAAELAAESGDVPELGGGPLAEPAEWPGETLLTCGSSVFVLSRVEPGDAHLTPRPEGGLAYNRPPRLRRPEPRRAFVRPKEPGRNEGLRLQLLAAFLPAVLGLTLALALQQWYYLLVALMTPIIMIGQWWSDRRHGKKQHRKAMKEYTERLRAYEEEVEAARAADEAVRRDDAPDPAQVLLTATGPRRRLWERRVHDPDALRLRVGLADLPADLELSEEQGDRLPPPVCRAVPVALPMRRLGVAGVTGPRTAAIGLASWLVAQAAALHSPRDLAIVVVSAHPDAERRWGWARWLPHCAPRAGEECVALVGADPESAARRVSELASLIDERQNAQAPELGKTPTGWDDLGGRDRPAFSYDTRPYDVLVVLDGAQVLRGLPNMPQVLRQGPLHGVFTLAVDDDQRLLPEECQTVAECGDDNLVRLRGGGLDVLGPVLADLVSPAWCDRLARALAPIRDVSRDDPAGNLPGAVRLLDLLGMPAPDGKELAARWGDHGSTRAVIGVGPEGPFSVDLRLDGPHGLIAGTTGAGKSELLQTLISALAVANRPDQLTFVLIDYKGGAAFKECVRLPHTVGMVTDLDGHLTQRALDSLAAEIRRRERLLAAAGAKDIDDYTGPALPRLVLIIDEFAALVAELPDFVAGLVDIARRGRSLGIHLILATQRPAGVVTADIQANTSLRIALRVTEPAESADVIDTPEAAHISKSTPGRCYVRSGVGTATAVQTARVGGRAPLPPGGATTPRLTAPLASSPPPGRGTGAGVRPSHIDVPHPGARLGSEPSDIGVPLAGSPPPHPGAGLGGRPSDIGVPLPGSPPPHPGAGPGGDLLSGLGSPLGAGARSAPSRPLAGSPPSHPGAPPGGGAGAGGRAGGSVRAVEVKWRALGRPLPKAPEPEEASGVTDLSLLADALIEAARVAGVPEQPRPWLEPLPTHLVLDLPSAPGHLPEEVPPLPFGTTDRPWAQDRRPLTLDLAHGGHLLIAGAARSGRSTALRTLAGSIAAYASPGDVHVHAVDCGSGALLPLVAMPHCGAVVTRDQLDRVERLLTRLRAEVARRQQLLAEAGHASLAEYRQAGHRLPWLVLMLDRWEGFVAAFESYDYGRLIESLLHLLQEGPAVGLRAVVTSDRSGLLGQVSTVFDDRLLLRLTDQSDFALAGFPLKGLPTSMPPGRALSMGEHGIVEHQIALLSSDPSGPAQVAALQSLARTAATLSSTVVPEPYGEGHEAVPAGQGAWRWAGEPPLRVDTLPMRITASQAMALDPGFLPPSPLWALVGVGGDALSPLGLDLLAHGPGAVIAGPARSGRSSVLLTAAHSLLARGTPVITVAPRRSPLRDLAGAVAVLDGNATDLADLVASHRQYVVLVDDAELVNPDSPLGTALEEVLRSGRDGDHGLLIAGSTGDLAVAYRGFVAEARKSRTGVLLAVQSQTDGDLFTIRLPRGASGGPPGRGLLVTTGTVTPIQSALPDPT
ncbi:FtsK/SpoIIIE domain-containing protein [Nonomuraea pusilla]|uniref:FtsK/SpoIIIE domain-containing protein n=1 Tax=Nonomuraea pusilla TaxID=46177 RepID=UPI0033247485